MLINYHNITDKTSTCRDSARNQHVAGKYLIMEQETIIIVSVFSAAWAVVLVLCAVLLVRVARLSRTVAEMQATGRIRVQKLKITADKNHAFQNPGLVPDEELSRRGYSMYRPDDVESGRGTTERQTGGQFVEELTREIDHRQQRRSSPPFEQLHMDTRSRDSRHQGYDQRQDTRHSTAPPFLLQAIEENKRKSRLANPVANGSGRQSDTNPNFIY